MAENKAPNVGNKKKRRPPPRVIPPACVSLTRKVPRSARGLVSFFADDVVGSLCRAVPLCARLPSPLPTGGVVDARAGFAPSFNHAWAEFLDPSNRIVINNNTSVSWQFQVDVPQDIRIFTAADTLDVMMEELARNPLAWCVVRCVHPEISDGYFPAFVYMLPWVDPSKPAAPFFIVPFRSNLQRLKNKEALQSLQTRFPRAQLGRFFAWCAPKRARAARPPRSASETKRRRVRRSWMAPPVETSSGETTESDVECIEAAEEAEENAKEHEQCPGQDKPGVSSFFVIFVQATNTQRVVYPGGGAVVTENAAAQALVDLGANSGPLPLPAPDSGPFPFAAPETQSPNEWLDVHFHAKNLAHLLEEPLESPLSLLPCTTLSQTLLSQPLQGATIPSAQLQFDDDESSLSRVLSRSPADRFPEASGSDAQ